MQATHCTIYSFLLLVCIPFLGHAATVEGTVRDEFGDPVVGATATLLNAGVHEHTDADGHFAFEDVTDPDTLLVEALGYTLLRQSITATGQLLQLSLKPLAVDLGAVTIRPELDAATEVAQVDLATQPYTSGQELLRLVPGMVIGQHAGGGKAEQLFLRGFDIDHGTDVAINVDGMPVNMVSHAHGQGYADLHWLIPETVERVDYEKGPYDARAGNFATAASIDFTTKRRLAENRLQVETGSFNYLRGLGLFELLDKPGADAYGAVEYLRNDGPFESPQGLQRLNAFAKTNFRLGTHTNLTASASHFTSSWTASGQVPQRAIDDGSIGRFGAIDDTEGGSTSRSNAQLALNRSVGSEGDFRASAYLTRYAFELYSNFTFFLEDPVNGDQIRQRERRWLGGGELAYATPVLRSLGDFALESGLGTRNDATSGSELTRTRDRTIDLVPIRRGDIAEQNQYAYSELAWTLGKWHATAGARLDHTRFAYTDKLERPTPRSANATSLNPKFRLSYAANKQLQVFAKAGSGYHANDARLIAGGSARTFMPKARGVDLGANWKPTEHVLFTGAVWGLRSEQEFVYVGDAGVVEPSGRSQRIGVDLGTRVAVRESVYAGLDVNLAHARSIDEPGGADRIPLAPPLTSLAYLIYDPARGFTGSARFRFVGDRPANEDYTLTAEGYGVVDLTLGYRWRRVTLTGILDNALDAAWNETQFATESRLASEPASVEKIHFTPGAPRSFRVRLGWAF